MSTIAVIQARMGSSRLPGKVLADVEGHPLLWYVVQRTRRARLVKNVVVAIPDTVLDTAIYAACDSMDVPCYAGAEQDVLRRYVEAAEFARADLIVRITADCPLIDPDVIDATIEQLRDDCQWASNIHPERTWPDGLDVEAFTLETLRWLDSHTTDTRAREHVTPLLYRGGAGPGGSLRGPVSLGNLRWTVDVPEDLEWVRQVYRRVPWDASWQQILFSGIEHRRAA